MNIETLKQYYEEYQKAEAERIDRDERRAQEECEKQRTGAAKIQPL